MVQTADSGLAVTEELLTKARDLAVQASDEGLTDADRQDLQAELTQVVDDIRGVGQRHRFKSFDLLDGSFQDRHLAAGPNGAASGDPISVSIDDMRVGALGRVATTTTTAMHSVASASIDTQAAADDALLTLDAALEQVAAQRGGLDSVSERLNHGVRRMQSEALAFEAGQQRVSDAQSARETARLAARRLRGAGAAALAAQGSLDPSRVLDLIEYSGARSA